MCEDASLQDERIKDLCKEIVSSQRREIDQMRALLEEGTRSRYARSDGGRWTLDGDQRDTRTRPELKFGFRVRPPNASARRQLHDEVARIETDHVVISKPESMLSNPRAAPERIESSC